MERPNPYLAHSRHGASSGPRTCVCSAARLIPYRVRLSTGEEVTLNAKPDVNPLNGRPYSKRYYDILKTRKGLPMVCCLPTCDRPFSRV